MLLIGSYRLQQIIKRKSDLSLRLMELNMKLQDLQNYASSIADGSVSLNDLMNVPSSMFNRMSVFMMYSHQSALSGAQQKIGPMMMMNQQNMAQVPPQLQQQYQQMMFKSLYDQERERFASTEKKILNQEEQKITKETTEIQTQLQMLDAEEKTTQQAVDQAAKDTAPKYA